MKTAQSQYKNAEHRGKTSAKRGHKPALKSKASTKPALHHEAKILRSSTETEPKRAQPKSGNACALLPFAPTPSDLSPGDLWR
eukprot:1161186-Pelagomonas_calceolata.AAC.16